jgi:hypothetical protein
MYYETTSGRMGFVPFIEDFIFFDFFVGITFD